MLRSPTIRFSCCPPLRIIGQGSFHETLVRILTNASDWWGIPHQCWILVKSTPHQFLLFLHPCTELTFQPLRRPTTGCATAQHIGPIRVREWPKVSKSDIPRGQFWQCSQIAKCLIDRKTLHLLEIEQICTRHREMNWGLRSAFGRLHFAVRNSLDLRLNAHF